MSGIRTGNFFINSKLDLRTLQLPIDQYRQMRRKSILFALAWLEENVMTRPDAGYHLREKTRTGIRFDDQMNNYLVNSCLHWLSIILSGNKQMIKKNNSSDRCHSLSPVNFKMSPTMADRPMTCPRQEIRIDPKSPAPKIYHLKQTKTRKPHRQRSESKLILSIPSTENPHRRRSESKLILSIPPIRPFIIPPTGIYRSSS